MMFVEEIRRAMPITPRAELSKLSALVWKGWGSGAINDADAQSLAEEIELRKAIPTVVHAKRRVGSRPRSPDSMERRRRWTSSGWLPPQIAARFTMAETAVLAVVASKVVEGGKCTLTLGHIAALAGVCKTTARDAIREARLLGLLTVEECRRTAFRSAPNIVKVVSPEWVTWLRLAAKRVSAYGGVGPNSRSPRIQESKKGQKTNETGSEKGEAGGEIAKLAASSAAVG